MIIVKGCSVSSFVSPMDSTEEPFTRRMLRRASLKREQEGSPNSSSNALRRKLSILQAINDNPKRNSSYSDCQADKHGLPKILSQNKHEYIEDWVNETQNCKENDEPSSNARREYSKSFNTKPSTSPSQRNPKNSQDDETDSTNNLLTNHNDKETHIGEEETITRVFKNHKTQRYPSDNSTPLNYIHPNTTLKPSASQNNAIIRSSVWKSNQEQLMKNSPVNLMIPEIRINNSDYPESKIKDTKNNGSIQNNEFEILSSHNATQHPINDLISPTRMFGKTSTVMLQDRTQNPLSSVSYIKGFELGNVKWRGPLYNAACGSSKYNNQEVQTNARHFETELHDVTMPQLLKVEHTKIKVPQKMRAELHTIDSAPETVADFKSVLSAAKNCSQSTPISTNPQTTVTNCSRPKLFLPLNVKNSHDLQGGADTDSTEKFNNWLTVQDDSKRNAHSPTTPLSAAIRDLDVEIQRLEFRPNVFIPDIKNTSAPADGDLQGLEKTNFSPTEYPTGHNAVRALGISGSGSEAEKNLPNEEIRMDSQENDFEGKSSSEAKSKLNDKDSKSVKELRLPTGSENISEGTATNVCESVSSEESQCEGSNDKKVEFNVESALHADFKSSKASSTALTFTKNEKKSKNNPFARVFSFMMPLKSKKPKLQTSNSNTTKESTSSSQLHGDATFSSVPNKLEDLENLQESLDRRETNADTPFEGKKSSDEALGDGAAITGTTICDNDGKSVDKCSVLEERNVNKMPQQIVHELPTQLTSNSENTVTTSKTLEQKMKKKYSQDSGLKPTSEVPSSSSTSPEGTSEDESIRHLQQQINIQQILIRQATKALNLCHSMREFTASPELVESERLLLMAGYRLNAALQAMQESACKENPDDSSGEKSQLTLKEFSLALQEDVLKDEGNSGEYVQWFVILVSRGLTVWATHAISCPVKSPTIHFPGCITIPNLTRDFRITVRVYSLKLRRVTYNYEEKYHLNRDEKHTRCPSPRNFLRRTERPVTANEVSTERNTSFSPSGIVELQLQDLKLTAPWPLMSVPAGSVLRGTINLTLSSKLHLSNSHVGFLTHCDEAGGFAVWNRRWCLLQGHNLVFWNYPRDQENKEPLLTIDLTNCVSEEVTTVDRSLCAKPKTLLIETARRRTANDRDSMIVQCRPACTIVRNLLSCDTTRDFTDWKSKLNCVISALRDWNVMTRRPQPQITDL